MPRSPTWPHTHLLYQHMTVLQRPIRWLLQACPTGASCPSRSAGGYSDADTAPRPVAAADSQAASHMASVILHVRQDLTSTESFEGLRLPCVSLSTGAAAITGPADPAALCLSVLIMQEPTIDGSLRTDGQLELFVSQMLSHAPMAYGSRPSKLNHSRSASAAAQFQEHQALGGVI